MTSTHDQFDNEAKLTAYVLGELEEEEAAAIERQAAEDEALRAEIEAIRQTTRILENELKAEPAPGLTERQREAIATGPQREGPVIFTIRRVWAGVAVAAAACIILALWLPTLSSARRSADTMAMGRADGKDEKRAAAAPADMDRAKEGREVSEPAPAESNSYLWGEAATTEAIAADALQPDRLDIPASTEAEPMGKQAAKGAGSPVEQPPAAVYFRSAPATPPAPPPAGRKPPGSSGGAGLGGGLGGGGGGMPGTRGSGPGGAGAAGGDEARRMPPAPQEAPARFGEPRDRGERLDRGEERFQPGRSGGAWNREAYGRLVDNPFIRPAGIKALSTFSIDVDTASYSNMRRWINGGSLPPPDAVRIEEMINYFDYSYEPASGDHPFSVNVEVNACPWKAEHRLVRIGLKGREVEADMRPATNLIFLLDVSGSMNQPNKLPLVRESMKMLVEHLLPDDRLSIVVYAGASGLVLPPTYCDEKATIIAALDHLRAGGSTHGSAGIQLAYETAEESFIKGGVNRVILCTDGDFNVGVSDEGGLVRLIEEKRKTGVFLSVLGFGTGNWQDEKMEQLSNAGNGNSAYIDSLDEARKVLIEEMTGTLVTIAKDVKIQVEFNPAKVGAYRLIGYANRLLEAEDFNDDAKDAGEIGAGHTVTALYEIVPPGVEIPEGGIDDLKYQQPETETEQADSDELLTVKLRYKEPDGEVSTKIEQPVIDSGALLADASGDFQFAAAVASFGMVLRDSEYRGDATHATVLDLASTGLDADKKGRRAEFMKLVEKARTIAEK